MSDPVIVAMFALVGVLITAAFTLVSALLASRQKANEALIVALQAERAADRDAIAEHGDRIEKLEQSNRRLVNYAHRLRQHIVNGYPPPPPEWPPGLDP